MILENPINGATISNFWINNKLYFDIKKGESFEAGDTIEIDDADGKYLQEIYEFLIIKNEPVPVTEKIEVKVEENGFKCEKCEFVAKSQLGLLAHKRKHENEDIKKVEGSEGTNKNTVGEIPSQSQIDAEAARAGLSGPGLEEEHIRPKIHI